MAQVAAVPRQERTNRLIAIGAVAFAALAAVLLFVALQSRDGGGGNSAVSTVDVVVASQGLSANTVLTADLLSIEEVPADSLLDGAFADTSVVLGLPLRYPVQAGEQITSAKIGSAAISNEDDISYLLKPGQRAFAVEADEVSAVGGLLLAGNAVDVIAVFSTGDGDNIQRAETILQNLTVLSVAQMAQEPVPAAAQADGEAPVSDGVTGERPDDIERQPDADSVTLAMTLEQAQLLAAIQDNDNTTIWLALRPAGDTENTQVGPTNLAP